jgi:hypothetical protein
MKRSRLTPQRPTQPWLTCDARSSLRTWPPQFDAWDQSRTAQCPESLRPPRELPSVGRHATPPRRELPRRHRYYELMRQSSILPPPRFVSLVWRVLAVCRQPLLEGGPSRRYLCNPCRGAWTHTPPRSLGALTRCFPKDIGLTTESKRSAREGSLQSNFSRGGITGLQSFAHVQAPLLARSPGCAHREGSMPFGRPDRLRHAMLHQLPDCSCGIATCLKRAIDTAGLAPAGSQPCRPLPDSRPLVCWL